MDGIQLVYKLKKQIEETQKSVQTYLLNGQVDNFEKYQYMVGQLHSLNGLEQDIRDIMKREEDSE